MSDKDTDIEFLKEKISDFIKERDWEQFHNPKDLAMSISIEASELMELFQWKSTEEIEALMADPKALQEMKDELADIVIYALSLSNRLDIDVSEAILSKLQQNAKKYPIEKAKGSAKKYTELQND